MNKVNIIMKSLFVISCIGILIPSLLMIVAPDFSYENFITINKINKIFFLLFLITLFVIIVIKKYTK